MFSYIIKRLLLLIPTLLGITLITFILVKNIPGDPVYGLIGQRASPEVVKQYKENLGLNESVWKQYFNYLGMIGKGNLGNSYYTHQSVVKLFWQKFPNTLRLAMTAMCIAILFGLSLGIISSLKRNTFIDRFILFGSTISISLPVPWLGIMLVIIFILKLHFIPGTGMGRGQFVYILLPAFTLGLRSLAYIARVTRASMLEVFNQPYVVSARARGVGSKSLILKHSLKNALIPIITMIALDLGSYLNGAVLTETVFGWDGIGRLAVTAIFKRDYPIVLAIVLWGAVIFVLINLIADILYQLVNPKIRIETEDLSL